MPEVSKGRWIWMVTLTVAIGLGGHVRAESDVAKTGKKMGEKVSGHDRVGTVVVESLPLRFANATTQETPDFQKHVMPLLGRLGCNGRSCHGSFQGRGGFALSLFGYDFKTDHEALMDESTGRVDVDDVDESLILAKPIDADMHEGGKRLDVGSWQYNTLRRWIESGAVIHSGDNADRTGSLKLESLEVRPTGLKFESDDQTTQLSAIAHWADGTVEDVTSLCRFASNDDAVAAVDEDGRVVSGLVGDTHVVVSYDRAVVPVQVIRARRADPTIGSPPESSHPIDRLIAGKHAELGIIPSPICGDAEFIRRASLDMTGTLPAAEDVRAFLADDSNNKRERLVDELLEAPGYAAWWATRMADWTGNSDEQLNNVLPIQNVAGKLWFEWLRVRFDDNMPYDGIVEGIVNASNRQDDETYADYCRAMTKACERGNEDVFASRDGMPLFWARRNFQKPEDRAIGFAYAFLGVRIECAQCHKHPFDQWSKDDFEHFSRLFQDIQARPNTVNRDDREERDEMLESITGGKKLNNGELRRKVYEAARKGEVVPFGELIYVSRNDANAKRNRKQKKSLTDANASGPNAYLLGQSEPIGLANDPRGLLMDWLRSPENPYFSKAIVNRVWANYFGIGIINPTDDMNLANPPSNALLLDKLATEFRDRDYDLHWLHRTIVTSDAYQRDTATNPSNQDDRRHFSRHVPRRLPAEVIRDAVLLATLSDTTADKMRSQLSSMSIAGDVSQSRNNRDFALQVFGQSERENNCDCDRSDAPSLLQSIYLRNDLDVYKQLDSKQGWVNYACERLGEQGPGASAKDQTRSLDDPVVRKLDSIRRQTIQRIQRLQALPEDRRQRQYDKVQDAYASVQKRFKASGFVAPPLKVLLNDPDTWTMQRVDEVDPSNRKRGNPSSTTSMAQVIEEAYLRTLSRFPDSDETQIALQYVDDSDTVADGLASLMWALVNTKEFIITH